MFLDSLDSLCLSVNEVYEPCIVEIVNREVKKNDVVLDIGANIGYYTLIFARLVGEGGKVFAFEPDPVNFELLKKNIEINGYKNVVLVQKAVSEKSETAKLYISEINKGDHRIYDPGPGDVRKDVEIETVRLDDYFKDYAGKIDFVKIDTQGAEGAVISGFLSTLQKDQFKNIKIITEFWPKGEWLFRADFKQTLASFSDLGFKLYDIDESVKETRLYPVEHFLDKYKVELDNGTNIFCVRG